MTEIDWCKDQNMKVPKIAMFLLEMIDYLKRNKWSVIFMCESSRVVCSTLRYYTIFRRKSRRLFVDMQRTLCIFNFYALFILSQVTVIDNDIHICLWLQIGAKILLYIDWKISRILGRNGIGSFSIDSILHGYDNLHNSDPLPEGTWHIRITFFLISIFYDCS